MKCLDCKKEIDNNSNFCEFCGAKIENINRASKINVAKVIFSKEAFYFWLLFIATVSLAITALFMLDGSSNDWEDLDLFMLLRLYIFLVSAYFAFLKYRDMKLNIAFLFIAIGITFNPFLPFDFNEGGTIFMVALISAIFFGYYAYKEYHMLIQKKNT